MDLRQLMQQARRMQEQMQRELSELEVESSVGGGMVSVKMNGSKQLLEVRIDPEDPAMVQDLVLAAVNEAARKVDEELQGKLGDLTGGIPGLPSFG